MVIVCISCFRCIRSHDIKAKALELHSSLNCEGSFTASNGWLERFKARQGISSRKITGYAQKIPKELPMLAQLFWDRITYESKLIMLAHISMPIISSLC